jgi:hypothetical protein
LTTRPFGATDVAVHLVATLDGPKARTGPDRGHRAIPGPGPRGPECGMALSAVDASVQIIVDARTWASASLETHMMPRTATAARAVTVREASISTRFIDFDQRLQIPTNGTPTCLRMRRDWPSIPESRPPSSETFASTSPIVSRRSRASLSKRSPRTAWSRTPPRRHRARVLSPPLSGRP